MLTKPCEISIEGINILYLIDGIDVETEAGNQFIETESRRVGARGWGREAEVQLFQDEVLLKMGFPTMRIYIIRSSKMGKTGHGMCF